MCPRIVLRSGFKGHHNQRRCGFSKSFCQPCSFTHKLNLLRRVAILLACATALAETPETLVKQALQRNPELNFFVAEIAAAKGAVRTAEPFEILN